MRLAKCLGFVFVLISFTSYAQQKKVSIFSGKGEVLLSGSFREMTTEEVATRYPLVKEQPTEAYQSADGMIVFAFFIRGEGKKR
ncbi:MAG: hypothetical protein QM731_03980 [Chitinophagaceae bacterium]